VGIENGQLDMSDPFVWVVDWETGRVTNGLDSHNTVTSFFPPALSQIYQNLDKLYETKRVLDTRGG
jgi:hypothetical protein